MNKWKKKYKTAQRRWEMLYEYYDELLAEASFAEDYESEVESLTGKVASLTAEIDELIATNAGLTVWIAEQDVIVEKSHTAWIQLAMTQKQILTKDDLGVIERASQYVEKLKLEGLSECLNDILRKYDYVKETRRPGLGSQAEK